MPGLSGFFATLFIKTIGAELGPNVKFGNGDTESVKRAAIIAGWTARGTAKTSIPTLPFSLVQA